jgi:hypothetical protein
MAAGALVAAASFVIASRSNSYLPMLVAYVALGVGVCAATFLPASLVKSRHLLASAFVQHLSAVEAQASMATPEHLAAAMR